MDMATFHQRSWEDRKCRRNFSQAREVDLRSGKPSLVLPMPKAEVRIYSRGSAIDLTPELRRLRGWARVTANLAGRCAPLHSRGDGLFARAPGYPRGDPLVAPRASPSPHVRGVPEVRRKGIRVVHNPGRASCSGSVRQAPLVFVAGVAARPGLGGAVRVDSRGRRGRARPAAELPDCFE